MSLERPAASAAVAALEHLAPGTMAAMEKIAVGAGEKIGFQNFAGQVWSSGRDTVAILTKDGNQPLALFSRAAQDGRHQLGIGMDGAAMSVDSQAINLLTKEGHSITALKDAQTITAKLGAADPLHLKVLHDEVVGYKGAKQLVHGHGIHPYDGYFLDRRTSGVIGLHDVLTMGLTRNSGSVINFTHQDSKLQTTAFLSTSKLNAPAGVQIFERPGGFISPSLCWYPTSGIVEALQPYRRYQPITELRNRVQI